MKLLKILLFLSTLLYLHCSVEGRDYFDTLKVSRGADENQIKRSYRKLALQFHPDKVKGTDEEKEVAAKKLAEINQAYEVLSDPEKRKIYERYGEEGLKQHDGQQQRGHGGGNLFDMFFGDGFGGRGGDEEEQIQKGHDVHVDLYVTLADLYVGKEFQVTRDKNVIKPAAGTRKCKCKQRLVTRQLGPGMFQQFTQQVCEDCPNIKLVREQEVVNVHVEPGMHDGQEIKFFEEGEPMVDGEAGDLKFIIRTLPNDVFERDGANLWINKTISLVEALTGFHHAMNHLDGHTVVLESSEVTKPGDVRVIPGEGMPHNGNEHRHGDLLVKYTVDFPDYLTSEQVEGVKTLFASQ